MKNLIGKAKTYFGLNEVGEIESSVPDATTKWKALAIDLNEELQESQKLHAKALDENIRLKRICECQSELLAERRS